MGCLRASGGLMRVPVFARRHVLDLNGGEHVAYPPGSVNSMPWPADRFAVYCSVRQMLRDVGIGAPVCWGMETPTMVSTLNATNPSQESDQAALPLKL